MTFVTIDQTFPNSLRKGQTQKRVILTDLPMFPKASHPGRTL